LEHRLLALQASSLELQPVVEQVAAALTQLGFAPERLSLSIFTHHPGLSGLGYVWRRSDERVEVLERPWGFLETQEHRSSPLWFVQTTKATLFLDEHSLATEERFPLIRGFAAAGATSYVALPLCTARGDVHVVALWTACASGWSSADVTTLSHLAPLLTLLVEVSEGRRLLGIVGAAHEVTQRALAEQALRASDALVRQQAADMARLEEERKARLETERELERAVARAEEAMQARSRFLAMMSHEIRTPMHGVLGLTELLSHSRLDEEQSQMVATLQGTGKALLALLNDILDFSKIEADRIEMEAIPFDPRSLLDEVIRLMRPSATSKGILIEAHCAPDLPDAVEGDPTRLRQVWTNLLGNAVKFTARGRVSVSLEVIARDEGRVRLRGVVRDTGLGIPPEVLSRLFVPFAQGDESIARRFGGTGLGLAICNRLIGLMHGELRAESREGEGSAFTFEVPLAVGRAVPTPRRALGSASLASLSVLVCDDNPVNRMITQRQLRAIGAPPPVLASSGLEALAAIEATPFDVVLMDIQMPELDGLETTRRLRAAPLSRQPRVIAMTANAFEDDRRACAEAGMDGFLTKPASVDALRAALASIASALPEPVSST
jgi:signal transduction histidine kinase/ActR/RegA family two-component response regulator